MTTVLSVRTRSGSIYAVTDDGTMTVTRKPGHLLSTSESLTVQGLWLEYRWSRSQARYVRELRVECPEGDFTTSELLQEGQMPAMVANGGTWRPTSTKAQSKPAKPQSTKPLVDLSRAIVAAPSNWTPPASVVPEGVMAAMAVYGD